MSRPPDIAMRTDIETIYRRRRTVSNRTMIGHPAKPSHSAATPCPRCDDRAARARLLLAWGSVLGAGASLLAAGAALMQVFVN
jgi:hypothetical protein